MSNLDKKLDEFYSKIHPAFRQNNAPRQSEIYNVIARRDRFSDTNVRQDQTPSFLQDSIKRARFLAQSNHNKSLITNMYGQFCPLNGYKLDDVYPVSDGMVHKISEPQFIDIESYPNPVTGLYNHFAPPPNDCCIGSFSYGAKLLSKMGWAEGDCLGKDKSRVPEGLELKVKTDRKGLAADQEKITHKVKTDIGNKNPVSILMEYCQKNRLHSPIFTDIEASGPSNMMEFKISVTVVGKTFLSDGVFKTKKEARAGSALVAVMELDL